MDCFGRVFVIVSFEVRVPLYTDYSYDSPTYNLNKTLCTFRYLCQERTTINICGIFIIKISAKGTN